MPGPHYAGEGRKADAVAHLALARSQNTETGILGNTKDKGSRSDAAAFLFHRKLRHMQLKIFRGNRTAEERNSALLFFVHEIFEKNFNYIEKCTNVSYNCICLVKKVYKNKRKGVG